MKKLFPKSHALILLSAAAAAITSGVYGSDPARLAAHPASTPSLDPG